MSVDELCTKILDDILERNYLWFPPLFKEAVKFAMKVRECKYSGWFIDYGPSRGKFSIKWSRKETPISLSPSLARIYPPQHDCLTIYVFIGVVRDGCVTVRVGVESPRVSDTEINASRSLLRDSDDYTWGSKITSNFAVIGDHRRGFVYEGEGINLIHRLEAEGGNV